MRLERIESNSDLKKFVSFQYSLYEGNKYWVPPLRMDEMNSLRKDKNPAFDFCDAAYWLVYDRNKIVGRIAGIINRKCNEKWNSKAARFGWFDFIDDIEVSSLLLHQVEDWAASNGMTAVHGPLGFTDMDGEGVLIEGFDEVSTLGALYNFPYYPAHIEKSGYVKDADWVEYQIDAPKEINEEVAKVAQVALRRYNLRILEARKSKDLLPYARDVFHVLNEAYKELYGFVALSDRQIDVYVKQYFGFIIPEFVPIVVDSDDRVVAFGITMPSMSEALQKNRGRLFPLGFIPMLRAMKRNNKADLYLTAVRPDMQNRGVNAILINEVIKAFVRNKIEKVETNRELQENEKVQSQWKFFQKRQHKRRRCYKKEL